MNLALLIVLLLNGSSDLEQLAGALTSLCERSAPSGSEREMQECLEAALGTLQGVEVRRDSIGNVVAIHGHGAPVRLFAATMDEVAYIVSGITDEGYLRLRRLANAPNAAFDGFHEGQPVQVVAHSGVRDGVVACRSTHLYRGEAPAVFALKDAYVDIGARSRDEVARSGVRILDPVHLRKYPVRLANRCVAAPAAGDRAACLALLALMARAATTEHEGKIVCAFLAQEKPGNRGTDRLRAWMPSDEVFLVRSDLKLRRQAVDVLPSVILDAADRLMTSLAARSKVPWAQVDGLELPAAAYTKAKLVGVPHVLGPLVLDVGTPVERVSADAVADLVRVLTAAAHLPDGAALTLPTIAPIVPREPECTSENERILAQLVNTYGVSGREAAVRAKVAECLPAWAEPKVDGANNLVLDVGSGRPHLLFVAHLDELGAEITAIHDDGLLELKRVGGYYEDLLEAQPALVLATAHGMTAPVAAIVRPRSEPSADKPSDTARVMLADVGARDRNAVQALGIAVGDRVSWRKQYRRLLGTRANGRSFDDRVGCTALIAAVRGLVPQRLKQRVTFAWVTEEEVGLKGSIALADRYQPDFVFAIDTFVSSDSPRDEQTMALAPIGGGAVVRAVDHSSITPRIYVDEVARVAGVHGIPLQIGTTGGGNDGSSFLHTGAIDVPLGWPLRYSHSPAEVIDLEDVDALAELCLWLAYEFKGADSLER